MAWFDCDNSGTNSDLTPGLGWNKRLLGKGTATQSGTVTRSVPLLTTDEVSGSWSTASNIPFITNWANGLYTCAVNVTTLSVGVSGQLQLVRVNSSGTVQETLGTSISFVTIGITTTFSVSINPASGSTGDRYQLRVLGTNILNLFGTLTITVDSNCFVEAPFVYQRRGGNFSGRSGFGSRVVVG